MNKIPQANIKTTTIGFKRQIREECLERIKTKFPYYWKILEAAQMIVKNNKTGILYLKYMPKESDPGFRVEAHVPDEVKDDKSLLFAFFDDITEEAIECAIRVRLLKLHDAPRTVFDDLRTEYKLAGFIQKQQKGIKMPHERPIIGLGGR